MERTIKRTVTATLCLGQRLNALGEFEDFDATLFRRITAAGATKYLRRKHKDETITINRVETVTDTYELSFEDFVRHARLVDSTDPNFEKEN